jgi:threonylcarbamoyladenosine tRNA methylthiotransferase MtaB
MKVAFYTLGCKVNTYETEFVLNQFKNKNYKIVDFKDQADIYVINTCTVTNTSDIKSRKVIRQAINRNKEAIIVVMGCYPQIKKDLDKQVDGIDIIIGNKDKSKVIEYVEAVINAKKLINKIYDLEDIPFENMELSSFETRTRAFVKIQDGCNNYCSYCIIPYARGNVRSKPKEKVISEVINLINNGYEEIVLTGIHTGSYGIDFNNYLLSDLIEDLTKINGLKRLRISSIEITEIDDKIIELLKANQVIANHLHIPLQSGSNKILNSMHRKYDIDYFVDKITQIRNAREDISITTDIIVGFPGETEEDFYQTYDIISKIKFTSLHVFPYSKRDGTKAATMPNKVDSKTIKIRVAKLIELSKDLEVEYMNNFIGKLLDIIPETISNDYLIGHSSNYLKIKYKGNKNDIGKLLKIRINNIDYPYCIGEIVK